MAYGQHRRGGIDTGLLKTDFVVCWVILWLALLGLYVAMLRFDDPRPVFPVSWLVVLHDLDVELQMIL